MTKVEDLEEETRQIDRMMNEEKGALLLQCVRNVAFQSGCDENELIAMLAHHSGISSGIFEAYKTFHHENNLTMN